MSGLSRTISKHEWDKTAAVINININYKMIASKCIKHEFKIHLQKIHIAQCWHGLSTSWQEGAVSPAMFMLSFLLEKKMSDFAWSFMQSALLIGSPFVNKARGFQPPRTALLLTGGSALRDGCFYAAKTALDDLVCSFLPCRNWKL